MVYVEVTNQDVRDLSAEVRNLPGAIFGGSGPLLRPFLSKLEEILPPEKRGRGDNYVSSTLKAHVDAVEADEEHIRVESEGRAVEITREELAAILEEKFPTLAHQNLNLPGLLFLQSGPVLQTCTLQRLSKDHGVRVPGGRRTLQYVFHTTVVSVGADRERVRIEFDLDRLPKLLGD
ncbi:MAG: hypothetical protein WCY97_10600 [Methanothrix sp.]|jgi:hypothetical protein|uniref:Uncharacterized protein n=1 Tax=Methanothrix harundinacea TaxID=301375 RepID=A0A101FW78_9EURY|nr:MAG: hypothetical protein APR56_07625 [Methanosaeta sp. SDB]KUK45559.1 MAG: Uncharacterized protein XD72_0033 [Methanothrix harundinacea]MDD2638866.1 hypothetical protein [Methanothrix sp.]MDI9398154.1 hypothetical protein [Euryarchaeota archaeon]KUK96787.1 MAG: Uncharacterized protein XE07_0873 [Methanothrix harundinacea]